MSEVNSTKTRQTVLSLDELKANHLTAGEIEAVDVHQASSENIILASPARYVDSYISEFSNLEHLLNHPEYVDQNRLAMLSTEDRLRHLEDSPNVEAILLGIGEAATEDVLDRGTPRSGWKVKQPHENVTLFANELIDDIDGIEARKASPSKLRFYVAKAAIQLADVSVADTISVVKREQYVAVVDKTVLDDHANIKLKLWLERMPEEFLPDDGTIFAKTGLSYYARKRKQPLAEESIS